MSEQGAVSEHGGGTAHFPPGTTVPTAAERAAERAERLRSPEHLQKLADAKKKYYERPLEERRQEIAEKQAAKLARQRERELKRAAKNGTVPPPTQPDHVPPTVRSRRGTAAPPAAAAPPPSVPRGGFIGVPRGLLDLCALMENLGDGSCFIQVNRVKPTVNSGINCAGILRPITSPIDDHEFALEYGGSDYTLRGYEYRENGRPRPVTEPVAYKVPGPPNLDSLPNDEDPMPLPQRTHNPNGSALPFRRPGVVTPQGAAAEAEMHDRDLTHKEEMDARQRAEANDRRRRGDEREQRERGDNLGMAKILAERAEAEAGRLADARREQVELLKEQQQRGNSSADFVELLKVMKPGEDSAALSRQHTAEIRQLAEGHKSEIIRISDSHREEMARLTAAHQATLQRVEDQARDDRKRSDDIVRATEQRSGDLVREAQTTADRRVSDAQNQARAQYEELRTRSEERVRDQNEQWQRRFDDLKELQARELRQKDSEITLMRTGLEGNMTVILTGKDTEIKRLQHEVRTARDEAEKNKDWVGKMKEMGDTAEALGYVKASDIPPEDKDESVQTIAIKAGFGALQRLPELIEAGTKAWGQIKNPGVPPELARAQARGGAPGMRTVPRTHGAPSAPIRVLPFATEDGGYQPPPGLEPPRPRPGPGAFPVAQDTVQVQQQQVTPVPQQQVPEPMAALPMQQQELPLAPPQPPQPPQQPAPQASVPPPAPSMVPPAPAQGGMPSDLDPGVIAIIGQLAPELDRQFSMKTPATDVAAGIVAENGAELVKMALGVVSIDQLIRYLSSNPGQYGALVSRNGQKFLREIWKSAGDAVGM